MSVINRMLADLEQRGAPAARAAGALHSPARSRCAARRDRNAIAMGVLLLPLAGVAVALWLPPGSVRLPPLAAQMSPAAPAVDVGARPRLTRAASVDAQAVARTEPSRLDAAPAAERAPLAAVSHAGLASTPGGQASRGSAASSPRTPPLALRIDSDLTADRPRAAAAAHAAGTSTPAAHTRDAAAGAHSRAMPSAAMTPAAAPATTVQTPAAPVASASGRAVTDAGSTLGVIKRASGAPAGDDAPALRATGVVDKEDRSSAAVRAQRRYAAARDMIARGQGLAARTQLREVLALDAGHHGARELLVAVLRHSGEHGEARELLARGLELAPARAAFATPYARLLVDAGELERAAQVLTDASASGAGDAEFHALAAAIAQQRGEHDEAVAQYTRAIEARGGREGRLWLGLGISLAANGRDEDAQRAYRAALDSGDLPARLHDWARSRIE